MLEEAQQQDVQQVGNFLKKVQNPDHPDFLLDQYHKCLAKNYKCKNSGPACEKCLEELGIEDDFYHSSCQNYGLSEIIMIQQILKQKLEELLQNKNCFIEQGSQTEQNQQEELNIKGGQTINVFNDNITSLTSSSSSTLIPTIKKTIQNDFNNNQSYDLSSSDTNQNLPKGEEDTIQTFQNNRYLLKNIEKKRNKSHQFQEESLFQDHNSSIDSSILLEEQKQENENQNQEQNSDLKLDSIDIQDQQNESLFQAEKTVEKDKDQQELQNKFFYQYANVALKIQINNILTWKEMDDKEIIKELNRLVNINFKGVRNYVLENYKQQLAVYVNMERKQAFQKFTKELQNRNKNHNYLKNTKWLNAQSKKQQKFKKNFALILENYEKILEMKQNENKGYKQFFK
ncbi:hypothetical protein PPERSA_06210 [Pseudocohnilembus persalinus]|uniref:Uncharacterized protein n=1 Tax=Pseudocohnilembus persalinus TaxID=266149 RepID=A0A0V0R189_PSEPJ|nr:hypothetical protein PPERSA_06210 [Pseudocohnilembus persalinus]|eukprot:KRX08032.1 hypothetical protein PPERSA_06210 [Pseudocohnilembus persalinus]